MASIAPTLPNYNVNPTPTNYSPIYGGVPGATAAPPSTYTQAAGVLPELPSLTAGAGNVVSSNLAGKLSPETLNAIKNSAAAWGVSSGMPLSGLSANKALSTVGLSTEQLQNTGLGQFDQLLTGLGSQQLSPSLLTDLSSYNAMLGAAPDPTVANQFLENLLNPASGSLRDTAKSNDWLNAATRINENTANLRGYALSSTAARDMALA
jgi:hypothetical protein